MAPCETIIRRLMENDPSLTYEGAVGLLTQHRDHAAEMPTDEWDAYGGDEPDDPDAYADVLDDPAREDEDD